MNLRKKLRHEALHNLSLDECGRRIGQMERPEKVGKLEIGWGQGTRLPREITRLSNLTTLHTHNTPLEEIPDWLPECPRLRVLMLRGADIRRVPPSLGQLDLRHLDLSDNEMPELPPEIALLRRLETLNLWGNSVSSIPDEILKLPRLRWIQLNNTPLMEEGVRINRALPHWVARRRWWWRIVLWRRHDHLR